MCIHNPDIVVISFGRDARARISRFGRINNILTETPSSRSAARITYAAWMSVAIEKLPRAIKHSRVLRGTALRALATSVNKSGSCCKSRFRKGRVDYARTTLLRARYVRRNCHCAAALSVRSFLSVCTCLTCYFPERDRFSSPGRDSPRVARRPARSGDEV